MARVRTMVVLFLLAAWITAPALACLPTAQMTQAEMACCKKMAGNCNMGAGQHPCCKTSVNRPSPDATIQAAARIHLPVTVCLLNTSVEVRPSGELSTRDARLGLPPPAPPGLNSILRI
jgi:hypothetical protein